MCVFNILDESMVIDDLAHLIQQFDYSYTAFANALQFLIDETEKAMISSDISYNDVCKYI